MAITFNVIVIFGVSTLVFASSSQYADEISCEKVFENCDDRGLQHVPLNQTWHFSLEGFWNLALPDVKRSSSENAENGESFGGLFSLQKIRKCEIKITFYDVFYGNNELNITETFVAKYDKNSARKICGKYPIDGYKTNYLVGLTHTIISAFTNPALHYGLLKKGNANVIEDDQYGTCPTKYELQKSSDSKFMVRKRRNIGKCSTSYQKLLDEDGHTLWYPRKLENYVENSIWGCDQYYVSNEIRNIKCFQDVTVTETAKFISEIAIIFLKSGPTADEEDINDFRYPYKELPSSSSQSQEDYFATTEQYLKKICENSKNGINNDVLLTVPKLLTNLNVLEKERIINIYRNVKNQIYCEGNKYFKTIFESIMKDTLSPAATSAKCQIILEDGVPAGSNWENSLGFTVLPTDQTLGYCSELLRQPSWTDLVGSVSALANTYKEKHCPQNSKNIDTCSLGENFNSITKTLWIKARNCHNHGEDYQKMALVAIKGLANIDAIGSDVTATLVSCVNSVVATSEVKIASLRALGKKPCSAKIPLWIQSLIFKQELGTDVRIEAFKTLYSCNKEMARDLLKMAANGEIDFRSSQVASYIDSYVSNLNVTNLFKLSRHFDLELDKFFGLSERTRLEGDIIFEDSFIPRSLRLGLDSGFLKQFGGFSEVEIRQENLEDILQPILGPEGLRGTLLRLLQEAILSFLDNFSNPKNATDTNHERQKRNINIEDIKTSVAKVKGNTIGKLKTLFAAKLGKNHELYSIFSFEPFFKNLEESLQEYLESWVNKLYYSIANYELTKGFSWSLRSSEVVSWTFFGYSLNVKQHEGILGTLGISSHIDLFSILKSPFSPSVDAIVNPSVGGYWHSSLMFTGVKEVAESKIESLLQGGFDLHLKIKSKVDDHLEISFNLPMTSSNGYSATIVKDLRSRVDTQTYPEIQSNERESLKYSEKGLLSNDLILSDPSVRMETEHVDCNEELKDGLGLNSCFEFTEWKGKQSSLSHSRYSLSKDDEQIDKYNLFISTKNSGKNSVFLSTQMETEGLPKKKEGIIVFGFNFSPHVTLKVMAKTGNYVASFEGTIVNDYNLKRLEARSKLGKNEYGVKAELLMVCDGGQVSIKPRLVVSRPHSQEDALLDGYIAHYDSDKVKSFTIDLLTDGSLKNVINVAMKGTTEYRSKADGGWSLSLKNLHIMTPGFEMGVESSLTIDDYNAEITNQVMWDGELFMMGGNLNVKGITDVGKHYDINFHFLTPSRPQWDTKLSLKTSFFDGQLTNNLTLLNGPEDERWQFDIYHLTTWKFAYDKTISVYKPEEQFSGLLQSGRTTKIANILSVSIPSQDWVWKLDHNFQASDYSVENLVTLRNNEELYTIMTNVFDQSEKLFKYHMEIEVEFPEWKFGYVDTLLQRGEGDIIGQSVAVMPSGRVYTSSSRLKYENIFGYLVLEMTYDTLVRDQAEEFRISFRHTLESTSDHVNFLFTLEAPHPLLSVEFSIEGLETHQVDILLKAFMTKVFEVELSSRSFRGQTDVSLQMDLMSLSKQIKSTVAVGKKYPGGGNLDGEIVMSSPNNPSSDPVFIAVSSSLEMKKPGIYLVRSDLALMGWGWSAEMKTELGKAESDPQMFTISVILPDKSSFEGKSNLVIDFGKDNQRFGVETEIKLPSNVLYKLALTGESVFEEGSLAQAKLLVDINSPFTDTIYLKTHFRNNYDGNSRNLTFFCDTHSEANYWNELYIDFNWDMEYDSAKSTFEGKFGEKRVILEAFGSYKIEKDIHNILMVSEVKLPSAGKDEQLKVSFDGHIYSSSSPPALKISQVTYVQKNQVKILETSGNLDINIPETKGSLTVIHTGEMFTNQEYAMKGSFTGKELVISIQGMIDHRTPVRINVQYVDGETLKLSASYGGSSYASLDFVSQLEGFSIMLLRNDISPNSKLTTSGNITYRNRHSRFHHVLRLSKDHSSSNLRVNSLKGKPLKLTTSRTKVSLNEWKTEGKLEWGSIKTHYSDEISFKSIKDFDVRARFHSPHHDLRHLRLHVKSSHDEDTDRKLYVKFTRENVVINSGKFTIKTTSLSSSEPFEINAELVDIVLEKQEYSDFKFRQFLVLPHKGLKMESSLKRGGIPLADIGLSVSEDKRAMLFSVCSTDTKCIRLNGQVNSFSQELPIRNFAVEIKFLNSLFGKRYYHNDIIEHTLTLNAENKLKRGDDIRLAAKLCRERCEEILCEKSVNIGKHHVQLKASGNNLDLLYETTNRTMLLKSSLAKGINKKLDTENSKLLKIKFWFDRIGKPDDVLIWTTSYEIEDSSAKVEETLISTLHHPYVERAVSITGKLLSNGIFKREAILKFDVFEEPHHALQLYILKDYRVGGYILQVDLKSIEDKESHVSLSTALIPSPDSGVFNLRVDTPRLAVINNTNSFSLKYNCKMEIDKDVTVINCQIKSPTTSDQFGLKYGFPPETCSGVRASTYIFNDTSQIHGFFCQYPLNIDGGISITENKDEDIRAKIGFEDFSNNFEIDILNVIDCDVTLLPPFLLQGIFESKGTPLDKLMEFKNNLKQKWNSLIAKSKILTSNLLHDSKKLLKIFRDVPKPSPLEKFSRIINFNSKELLAELKNDDLFVDMSEAVETSANISNVILQLGMTYVDYITGGNMSLKPFSFYYKKAFSIVSNLATRIYKNAKEEAKKLLDYAKIIGYQFTHWFKEISNYVLEETGMGEPLKWLLQKLEILTSNISWPPFIKVVKDSMGIVQKILSLFYSNVNYDTSGKMAIIIPLGRSVYSLPNLFSLERGAEGVKSYPTVSLRQEIDKWKHMVTHPQQFAAYIFPHFNAQGVIVDDNIINFDGNSNVVDFSCPHLLLVLKESNSSTTLSLAAGHRSLPFDGHKELVLLYGENRIVIEPDRNIIINNESISLPYEQGGISILRDLRNIEINVKSSKKTKLLSLNCEMERDICVVDINGWLQDDTFGLLGSFDNDPYNDFILPDGSSVVNSEVWEDSWMIDENCSKIVTGVSYLKEPSERALKFCSKMFLDNDSPAVPCHGSVDIHPYYINCLNAQRALDYPTRKTRTTNIEKEQNKITEKKDNHYNTSEILYEDYQSNYQNVLDEEYDYLQENFFFWRHNGNNSLETKRLKRSLDESKWKPAQEHDIKLSLHDITSEETKALCNVFSAYTKTCLMKSANLILPLECDFSYLNHEDDSVVHHSLSIDLLILYEESECSTFVYESVVSVIQEDIIELLNSSSIDFHIGVIGYESSEDLPVTLYGKGNSLLTPLDEYSPPDLHLQNRKKGSLLKALHTAQKYPFRKGTIRVIFVASCSDQDISKSSSILSKNFAERRIILFALTPKQLYVDPLRPKAARNIIGLNSVSIYHLRKGVFKQGISAKLSLPSTNVAHLSLQTGGSIFSIESFKEDKKSEIHMKTFRQILAKAFIQTSNKLYSKLIEHV